MNKYFYLIFLLIHTSHSSFILPPKLNYINKYKNKNYMKLDNDNNNKINKTKINNDETNKIFLKNSIIKIMTYGFIMYYTYLYNQK